jgi:hypothetical protein
VWLRSCREQGQAKERARALENIHCSFNCEQTDSYLKKERKEREFRRQVGAITFYSVE